MARKRFPFGNPDFTYGGAYGTRTRDLIAASDTRSQLR